MENSEENGDPPLNQETPMVPLHDGCGVALCVMFALPLIHTLRIVTLLFLWNWFVSPLGTPRLNFWHCAGLWTFLHVVQYKTQPKPKRSTAKEEKPEMTFSEIVFQTLAETVMITLVSLIGGWFLHRLM